jgi:membrane-associated protease RseP (regulator of RpoE activity)
MPPPPPQEFQIYGAEEPEVRVAVRQPPRRPYWLHVLLFLLTVLSTLCIGAKLQDDFNNNIWPYSNDDHWLVWTWALQNWRRLVLGIPFSASLLGILTMHELGHYALCVRRRVYATLPYFIPAPTLIGTFGAFIRIKSLIRSRKDLFDIGVAGPIAGFLVAVPVLLISLLLSKQLTVEPQKSWPTFGLPLIFYAAHHLLRTVGSHSDAALLNPTGLYLHPMAVAAWVGMFATSLNLIPAGQLDGGHILFAISPRTHRIVSLVAIPVLFALGVFFSLTWFIWAIFLVFARRHPPVMDQTPLDGRRNLLALFGLLILALTFTYSPIANSSLPEFVHEVKQAVFGTFIPMIP